MRRACRIHVNLTLGECGCVRRGSISNQVRGKSTPGANAEQSRSHGKTKGICHLRLKLAGRSSHIRMKALDIEVEVVGI
jgi:hypothetical protein